MQQKVRAQGHGGDTCFGLLALCGISTFIMGALTGGFFGDFLTQLAKLINPRRTFSSAGSVHARWMIP